MILIEFLFCHVISYLVSNKIGSDNKILTIITILVLFMFNLININYMNDIPLNVDSCIFDDMSTNIDSYCINNDIDDYDLFGEKLIEDNQEETDIEFE